MGTKMKSKIKSIKPKGGFKLPTHKYGDVISTLSQKNGWGITQCKIPSTWKVTEGEGETVMVIDTGWSNHKDLGKNSVKGICTVTGNTIEDNEGHGCVSSNTMVYTNDTGLIKIQDLYNKINIQEDDVILKNNTSKCKDISNMNIYTISIDKNGNTNRNKITHIYKSYIDTEVINCILAQDITHILTPWHKVPIYSRGTIILTRADELTINDKFSDVGTDVYNKLLHYKEIESSKIINQKIYEREITKITKEPYNNFMYDFSVENDNTYLANGQFVSNTHCSGIIAAKNNNTGMVGVAPKCKVIAVKALGDNGSGSFASIANALDYAIKIKPSVISMSLGAPSCTKRIETAIKKLYAMGIPVVCAAGNDGARGVDYPGKYPETIAIAAYDKKGKIANFSAIGEEVDLAAPGVGIYSTYLNNKYTVLSGTSMACPFVAGVIALLISKHKKQEINGGTNDCKTVEEIRQHLLKYTVDKGYVGKDYHWGYGVLDINKMMLASNDPNLNLPIYNESNQRFKSLWEKFLNIFR